MNWSVPGHVLNGTLWVPGFWPFTRFEVSGLAVEDGLAFNPSYVPESVREKRDLRVLAMYPKPSTVGGGYSYIWVVCGGPGWARFFCDLLVTLSRIDHILLWLAVSNYFIVCEEGGVMRWSNWTLRPRRERRRRHEQP